MKVKMTIVHIIKSLLKSKIIYNFELIYRHGLVSGITSLSDFTVEINQPSFSWTSQIFNFRKMFLFLSGNLSFSFFTNTACKFWKDVNSIIHGKAIILLNQARILFNHQGQCLAG